VLLTSHLAMEEQQIKEELEQLPSSELAECKKDKTLVKEEDIFLNDESI
jgi:hypothetical protein